MEGLQTQLKVCLLSPLLFNLLIDDIKTIFDKSCDSVQIHTNKMHHLLYADDLILISSTAEGLHNCLNQLSDYCFKWDLRVNTSKSKFIVFNKSGKILGDYKFSLDKKTIDMVQSYCYLGIDMSANGSFGQAISNLDDKAGKAMFTLTDTIFKFDLNIKKSVDLFHRLIAPIVLYGCEIWSTFPQHQLNTMSTNPHMFGHYSINMNSERIHLKFLKLIPGVKRNCPFLFVLGETGELPLTIIAAIQMIKYWHRLTTLTDNCPAKLALYEIENSSDISSHWKSSIKHLLKLMNLENVYGKPCTYGVDQLNTLCKNKMRSIFTEFMNSELSMADIGSVRNSKLRAYKQFKSKFALENYLTVTPNFENRKFIAKFRCNASISLTGSHPPGLTAGPLIFSVKIPAPGTAFQCKTPAPGSEKRNKIPTPGRNLPSSNAKISMK